MSTARILIVEDDVTLNNQVAALLRNHGFSIDQCHDGQQGLVYALREQFDVILLDATLPSLCGFSFLNLLRQKQQKPIVIMTDCADEQARILGYQCGADDSLPKPFNLTEIRLKIEAALRRMTSFVSVHQDAKAKMTLGSEDLMLERTMRLVLCKGREVALTPVQFNLLWVLVEHQGKIMSKDCLCQIVLERTYSPLDRSLDMHISRIRKKLAEAGVAPAKLSTVHGQGYRFS